jgi:serine/threonine protein phosphatase PrpC
MEDAHAAELKLGDTEASYFGVYDGHGGKGNPPWNTNDYASLTMFDRFDCSGIHWQGLASQSQGKLIL